MIAFLAVMLAATVSPLAADGTNPLAPAAAGKMQCYSPDREKRTCRAIARYVTNGRGGYDNEALVLLSPAPLTTLETVTPVAVKNGAVCGYLRAADTRTGVIRREGEVLSAERAKPLFDAVAASLAPMVDREICTRYLPSGDHLLARATLDGAKDGFPDDVVIWVSPEEGYRVSG